MSRLAGGFNPDFAKPSTKDRRGLAQYVWTLPCLPFGSVADCPMTITLTPEQEKLVMERVSSGQYLNPEHLAAEALRLLTAREEQEQELSSLRRSIDAGWEEAEAGLLMEGPGKMSAMLRRAGERVDRAR